MSAYTYTVVYPSNMNQSVAKLHFYQLFLLCVNSTEAFY